MSVIGQNCKRAPWRPRRTHSLSCSMMFSISFYPSSTHIYFLFLQWHCLLCWNRVCPTLTPRLIFVLFGRVGSRGKGRRRLALVLSPRPSLQASAYSIYSMKWCMCVWACAFVWFKGENETIIVGTVEKWSLRGKSDRRDGRMHKGGTRISRQWSLGKDWVCGFGWRIRWNDRFGFRSADVKWANDLQVQWVWGTVCAIILAIFRTC